MEYVVIFGVLAIFVALIQDDYYTSDDDYWNEHWKNTDDLE